MAFLRVWSFSARLYSTVGKRETLVLVRGFTNSLLVYSRGSSGGLLLRWHNYWKVDIRNFSTWHMDLVITNPLDRVWHLTGFYGHLWRDQRHQSRHLLRHLRNLSDLPWCYFDDFNENHQLSSEDWGLDEF